MDWQTISSRIHALVDGGGVRPDDEQAASLGVAGGAMSNLPSRTAQGLSGWQPALPKPFKLEHLWMLRVLVPMGGEKEALTHRGLSPNGLVMALGLTHWEGEPPCEQSRLADLRALHALAEAHADEAQHPEPLRSNVQTLGRLMDLNALDCEILELALLLHTNSLFDDTADKLGHLVEFKRAPVVSRILNVPEQAVLDALGPNGNLLQKGLFNRSTDSYGLLRNLMGLAVKPKHFQLSYSDPMELVADNCTPLPEPTLGLADYEHLQPMLGTLVSYLRQALAQRKQGVNVLLYGSPGTGKTELVALLGSILCEQAWAVPSADEDGDPLSASGRTSAYRFAQSLLKSHRTLLLFDEAEDVFQPMNEGERSPRNLQKCWFTKLLEENILPCIWVANRISGIDSALVRRFDMVLEVPVPPRPQRRKVLKAYCGSWLGEPLLEQLADSEDLAPAVVARAAQVMGMAHTHEPIQDTPAVLRGMLSATLCAQGHSGLREMPDALPGVYDPAWVNTDVNLHTLASGLLAEPHARLCLYGPPGTGKSAWARWLAQHLQRPLLVKRASDLMSKFVGGTERLIAQAFHEAHSDGAVLLLDEVDSFLRDRRQARASWEVTEVNEMLTQMECFNGVFVASTNLIDGMDPASMRRFDLKVQFQALRHVQALGLLVRHAQALGLGEPTQEESAALSRCNGLTPGDFATVARQHRFRKLESISDFITRLKEELKHRQPARQPMGFLGGILDV